MDGGARGWLGRGLVGALVEDSGPVLFVVAVFTLGCVLSYIWGKPRAAPDSVRMRAKSRSPATVTNHEEAPSDLSVSRQS